MIFQDPDLSATSVLPLPALPLRYVPAPDRFVPPQRAKEPHGFLRCKNVPMQWPSALSTFVLTRMAELVKDGLDSDSVLKDKSLDKVCKDVLLFCGAMVSNTQLYNHLRMWSYG